MPDERQTTAAAELVDQVFAVCADDPVCAAAYPDLTARFARLFRVLDAAPLALGPEVTGHALWRVGRPAPGTLWVHRTRAHQRRHALGGSGAYTHRPVARRPSKLLEWLRSSQVTL